VPFHIAIRQDTLILKLEGAITIRDALDLASSLAQDLHDGTPVAIDTQGLEDIDTCVLQLLCSLRKTNTALSFDNPSEVFVSAVERCGLRRDLLGARGGL